MTGRLHNLWAKTTPIIRPPVLGPRDVHVWQVAAIDWPTARSCTCLSAVERHRAATLRLPGDRALYLAAHCALRHLLGLYLGRRGRHVHLRRDRGGKPRLATGGLSFNLSHSGGQALIAITRAAQTGVDIECRRPLPRIESLAARFLSDSEQRALRECPPVDRAALFFQIWALKEAFIKATGRGLSQPLNGFELCQQPDNLWKLREFGGKPGANWSAHALPAGPDMRAALVVSHARPNIALFRISALRGVARRHARPSQG